MESLPGRYTPEQPAEVTKVGDKLQITEGGQRAAKSTEARADALVRSSLTEQPLIEGSHVTVVSQGNAEYLHQPVDQWTRQQIEGGQNVAKDAAKVVKSGMEAIFDTDDDSSEAVVLVHPGSYDDDMPVKQQAELGKGKEEINLDSDDESSEAVVLEAPGSYDIQDKGVGGMEEEPFVRTDESKKTAGAMREERKPIETGEPDALGKVAPQSRAHTGLKGVYMGIKQSFNNFIQHQRVEKAGGNISEEVLKGLVRDCAGSKTKLKALGNALQGQAEHIGKEKVEALLQGKIPPSEDKQVIRQKLSDIGDQKPLGNNFKLGLRDNKFVFEGDITLKEKKQGALEFMHLIREAVTLGIKELDDEFKVNSLPNFCERLSTSQWAKDNLSGDNRLYLAQHYAETTLEELETRINTQFTPLSELAGAMKVVLETKEGERNFGDAKLHEEGNTIEHDWGRQLNARKTAEESRPIIEKLKAVKKLRTPEKIIDTLDIAKNPVFGTMYKEVSKAIILVEEVRPTGKFARDVFKLYVGDNESLKQAIDDFYNDKNWMGLNKYMMDLVKERNTSK